MSKKKKKIEKVGEKNADTLFFLKLIIVVSTCECNTKEFSLPIAMRFSGDT